MSLKPCDHCIGIGKDPLDQEKDCPFCAGSGWLPDMDNDEFPGDEDGYY